MMEMLNLCACACSYFLLFFSSPTQLLMVVAFLSFGLPDSVNLEGYLGCRYVCELAVVCCGLEVIFILYTWLKSFRRSWCEAFDPWNVD